MRMLHLETSEAFSPQGLQLLYNSEMEETYYILPTLELPLHKASIDRITINKIDFSKQPNEIKLLLF